MVPRFRLDPVLRYRVRREDAVARAFAEAVRSVEAAARHLAWIRGEETRAAAALHRAASDGALAGWLRVLADVPVALSRDRDRAGARLDVERGRAEEARRVLVEASRDRQALERLRELAAESQRRRTEALAQREHDERARAAHWWRQSAPELGGRR
jgi:flagellar FliJ protein